MNKFLGLAIVLMGVLLFAKFVVSGATMLIIVAAVLAIAASSGLIGRSGYVLAAVVGLLALSGFAARSIFFAFGMLFKMLPLILVLIGIYVILRAFSSK